MSDDAASTPMVLEGKDNHGKLRQEFADKIAALDETGFLKQAEQSLWLSAYAANNPRSDYHWQADACFVEAVRRDKPELFRRAWERASNRAKTIERGGDAEPRQTTGRAARACGDEP